MRTEEFRGAGTLRARFRGALAREEDVVLRTGREEDSVSEFARSTARGLSSRPRRLDCRFLYDRRGSEIYEKITRLPEYYPTRTEASILKRCSGTIREVTGPVTLVELGSGSSRKTDHLLAAHLEEESTVCYVPVDVSESALRQAGDVLARRRPNTRFIGLSGTYDEVLPLLPETSPVMVIFLGSTIGNLDKEQENAFWARMGQLLPEGDFFLLGIDLVKDRKVIHDAYNDAAGLTASFTRNLFARMNRELGAGLDLRAIEHDARWSEEKERVEIYARFTSGQRLEVEPLRRSFLIDRGEEILVEISRKFRPDERVAYLRSYGFEVRRVFTDDKRWFALMLLERRRTPASLRS